MAEIEEVLWNIFTSYSLNGNPKDPSRMNGSGLLKMCRDIRTLDPVMTECPLTQAYLDLIYTSEIKSPKKVMSYIFHLATHLLQRVSHLYVHCVADTKFSS